MTKASDFLATASEQPCLHIDLTRHRVWKNGKQISLGPTEFLTLKQIIEDTETRFKRGRIAVLRSKIGFDILPPKPVGKNVFLATITFDPREAVPQTLSFANIFLSYADWTTERDGRRLVLKDSEFRALGALMEAPGHVISGVDIFQISQQRSLDLRSDLNHLNKSIKTFMSRLRQGLGRPNIIETVREAGYRLTEDAPRPLSRTKNSIKYSTSKATSNL